MSITITVLDVESKQPLENAIISQNKTENNVYKTDTDGKSYITLLDSGKKSIKIERSGYKTASFPMINGDLEKNIHLTPVIEKMETKKEPVYTKPLENTEKTKKNKFYRNGFILVIGALGVFAVFKLFKKQSITKSSEIISPEETIQKVVKTVKKVADTAVKARYYN